MEKWKSVLGYEGLYEVSNLGQVRSIDRYVIQHSGSKQLKKGRILSPSIDRIGYVNVALSKFNKLSSFKVHKLVAIAWISNPLKRSEVNHKDCNKENNNADNLEWSTRSENIRHAVKNGLIKYKVGYENSKSLLNKKQYERIRDAYFNKDITVKELCKQYKVNHYVIYRILKISETLKPCTI